MTVSEAITFHKETGKDGGEEQDRGERSGKQALPRSLPSANRIVAENHHLKNTT